MAGIVRKMIGKPMTNRTQPKPFTGYKPTGNRSGWSLVKGTKAPTQGTSSIKKRLWGRFF